ncbi:hypothetical protein GT646_14040 [Clostridium butyricum]|uniref:hypothetical protein n=1 Tax=Clostridium butyricum TaxID=1492 RepID=UPI00136CD061|nr:hypothetical protein [Clostridium butyricum]MZI81956.1 hypothetical protein [Clostridium butyricum]
MSKFNKNYYKIMMILGILMCILWISLINTQPYSDFYYYNKIAQQIANGGQWGDTYTTVGYSIILGGIYSILGYHLIIAKIFNLVLTLISYIVFYKILKKIDLKESRRKIIYTLFIFFPSNIFYTSVVGNEILFTTILLIITLIYYSNVKLKYALIGLLVAINSMIKPFFIIFFLVIFILELFVYGRYNLTKTLKHTVTILLVSLICIFPWIYRNTKLIGQPTFISNNSGIVLYINNNSQNINGRWMSAEKIENSVVLKDEYIQANATQKNKMLTKKAKDWIITHPLQFVELGFKRLFNTYFIADDIFFSLNLVNLNKYLQILIISYVSLIKLIIFIPSIVYIIIHSKKVIINLLNRKNINSYELYNLVCFYMFTCVYFVTEGQGRYSFPCIFIAIYFFSPLVEKFLDKYFIKDRKLEKTPNN